MCWWDWLLSKIQSDIRAFDNVKQGMMAGSNNAKLRATLELGKEMHRKLRGDRNCDEKEVSLSSGRPDCIKFDEGDCKVIEFKPDSYSEGQAESQAKNYIGDVRERFKHDDRAKRCKQDGGFPVFRPVGETYRRCQ